MARAVRWALVSMYREAIPEMTACLSTSTAVASWCAISRPTTTPAGSLPGTPAQRYFRSTIGARPESRFPAAIDDAVAAFQFALDHASELGADPARVAVGGDSAGGNLAAGVACLAASRGDPAPAFQLLFYPWLDLSRKRASYDLFGDGFYLTERELDRYKGH